MRYVEPSVTLEWITPEPLLVIERAGRTCYKSEDKITPGTAAKFCTMIQKRGHESVIEHASASFRIVCDRGVSHEIVRHRLASYSQESTRYCNYNKAKFGGEIGVVLPPEGSLSLQQLARRDNLYDHIQEVYSAEVKEGISPQIARGVLPTSLKTELVMTCNFREWLHFLDLRTSAAAHPQMREIAKQIGNILAYACPEIFGRYVEGARNA